MINIQFIRQSFYLWDGHFSYEVMIYSVKQIIHFSHSFDTFGILYNIYLTCNTFFFTQKEKNIKVDCLFKYFPLSGNFDVGDLIHINGNSPFFFFWFCQPFKIDTLSELRELRLVKKNYHCWDVYFALLSLRSDNCTPIFSKW
jgi:hypothetical protein